VTNTFVLPTWAGAWSDPYLVGVHANQWAWHMKHVTAVTSYSKCCEQSASQKKMPGLDVNAKSPTAHDTFWPMTGLISCTGITGRRKLLFMSLFSVSLASFPGSHAAQERGNEAKCVTSTHDVFWPMGTHQLQRDAQKTNKQTERNKAIQVGFVAFTRTENYYHCLHYKLMIASRMWLTTEQGSLHHSHLTR